jgi:tRNA (guanine37-N1)-methyltransferase
MSTESLCLKVHRTSGEKAIVSAHSLGLSDNRLEILKENDTICIPITRKPKANETAALKAQAPEFQLATRVFQEKARREKTLEEALENQLPPHLLASLPRALDIVGDIAIVEIPPELEPHKHAVGEAVLRTHRNVRVVLAKAGAVSGTYRLRELDFLAGERRTTTVHKEYGASFHVDLAKAYFSPRLSYEHRRVASQVRKGETVVDLFAGVGPFAVLIAINSPEAKVYAIDLNADAVELLKENIRLNRVESRVYPILGDARQVVSEKLSRAADRVIMNLPEKAAEFVDVACHALKPGGGTVQFYGFIRLPETLDTLKQRFSEAVEKAGRKVANFAYAKAVRATAPYEWQAVLDAEIL